MKAKACVKGARACPESVDYAILSAAFLVSPTDRESRIEIYRERDREEVVFGHSVSA
jgi:hypothetical protein